jgi:hypothetical protein
MTRKATYLLAVLAACAGAQLAVAQSAAVAASKTTLRVGETVTVTWLLLGGQSKIAALQYDEQTTGPVAIGARVGAVPTPAQKLAACGTSPARCVIYGLNQTAVPDGPLVTAGATATAPGVIRLGVTNLVASDANGNAVPFSATPELVLTVLQPEDLNGDGKLDTIDVQISLDQVQGRSACGSGDLNADGKCNVRDLQLVVNALVAAAAQ